MKTLEQILENYKHLLDKVDYKNVNNDRLNPDVFLFMNWAYRIPKNWYGFALTNAVPMVWAYIIDAFLQEVEKECPNFEIHQIKLKFSSIRVHIELNCQDKTKIDFINEQIDKLELLLQDDALYY